MNNKIFWTLQIVFYAILFVALFYIVFQIKGINNEIIDRNDKFLKEIDKIELQINSLDTQKDSIRTVIDSTHVKIVTNEKHYQEIVNTIISQPTSADYKYVTDYIRQYRSKNDSINLR